MNRMTRKALLRFQNNKGIAIPITLMILIVLLVLGSIFILRIINEWNTVNRQRQLTQAFYIAEGGSQAALKALDILINTDMLNTISATNPQVVINLTVNYVTAHDGLGFLILAAKKSGVTQFTLSGTQAVHHIAATAFGAGTYECDIVVTEKTDPHGAGPDKWDFPYYYRLQTTARIGGTVRKVLLAGDFTVRVQRDNFAKYALFTNRQTMPSGTEVWFTNRTNFSGPIHTNDRFNFALNPSGIFDGAVTQHEQTARFYNNGWPVLMDAQSNGTRDVPTFHQPFSRGADEIVLSSSVEKQDMVDEAKGGTSPSGNGIFVPNNGTQVTGGIYVNGNASVNLGLDAGHNAVYTVTQGTTTKIITVNRTAQQTAVQTVGGGTVNYTGIPDGMDDLGTLIFVNGNISSLAGTVQEDTEITIASENDIVITNNLVYGDYTPAQGVPGDVSYVPPTAEGADNLLGIVAWNGDVRISTAAPDNINVHGSILAQDGIMSVDDYNNQGRGSRGSATLLGGVISDYYGAFGLFNGTTGQQISGYGRNFVYDGRMLVGKSPPYFPSLNTFIAFTNDLIDKITFKESGF